LPACASVLVKGSRFMKMERVVEAMRQQTGAAAPAAPSAPKETTC